MARSSRIALIILATVVLGACAGVLDWCGDGLNPPPGGWDRHAPG